MRNVCIFCLAVLFNSCQQRPGQPTLKEYFANTDSGAQTGGIKMVGIQTPRGKFNVWTKRIGNNPRIKVLLLHGGPGGTHEFFECFESFLPREGIEFIEYDQLGSYYSDQPKDTSLWTTERFVEEVEQLRAALGLNKENFFLLGHSWGGILAMEYALKYQDNLKGLIISNMMASLPAYEKYNLQFKAQMPKSAADSLEALEEKGQYSDTVYERLLMDQYWKLHMCRLDPWPDPLVRAFRHFSDPVLVTLIGAGEFKIGGRLIHWDRSNNLGSIKVPTLTIGGTFDTMDPKYMEWMSSEVQNGRFLLCPDGSHCAMWDDQAHYFPGLIKFLQDVDMGQFRKTESQGH